MALTATNLKITYNANGSQTVWDITFPILLPTDVQVILTNPSGVDQAPLTANYDVDTVLSRVTYPTAISGLPPVASGWKLSLKRVEPLTQSLTLQNFAPFNAADIMTALDKLTMIAQQQQDQIARAPRQRDSITAVDLILPLASTGKAIGWASDGTLTNLDVSTVAGLGTMATQNANAVAITGGSITLSTALAIASGGTGATTRQAAMNALGNAGAAGTDEFVLTKDTSTGDIILKAAPTGLFTDANPIVYITNTARGFAVGGNSALAGARNSFYAAADQIQVIMRGHSTQTGNILEVRKSDDTVQLGVTNSAGVICGGTTSQVKDLNGNELLKFGVTPSAINEITITNAATTGHPKIESSGGDSNPCLDLSAKGVGGVRILKSFMEKESTLTDGANVTLDASLGNVFVLSAAGNRTIDPPTNPPASGFSKKILIKHIASGGARTLTLSTASGGFIYGSDITGLTATASGKTDVIGCQYDHTLGKWMVLAVSKGY